MSTSRSSPDIGEKPDGGNAEEEIGEEHEDGVTQEEINKESNEGSTKKETGDEESNEGSTGNEIVELPAEGSTQDEISKESNEGSTKEKTGDEESNEGNTGKEIVELPAEGSAQDEISKESGEGNSEGDNNEEPNQSSTKEIDEVPALKLEATEDKAKEIFGELKKVGVPKIILIGKTGTGKTWMAKKICYYAEKEKHPEPIWISLDKKHDNESLEDTIGRQFSLPTSADKREEDGEDDKKEKNVKHLSLKEKMIEKLEEAKKAGKIVLLVLDGEVGTTKMDTEDKIKTKMDIEDIIKTKIFGLSPKDDEKCKDTLKVLITTRETKDNKSVKFELAPFSVDEAIKLFREKVVLTVQFSHSHSQAFENVCKAFQGKNWKPAEILMLAGTLNYIANDRKEELEPALEVAASGLKQLLRYAYDKERGNSFIDCFWHSWNFLGTHGGVHYNELITSWIMEDCLPHTNQIDKAYDEGHAVLMKLIDYYLLKMQEDDIVVLEGATLDLGMMDEDCRRGYLGKADPGLASVLKGTDETTDETNPEEMPLVNKVLEGITPADGMMTTLCGDKNEKMISSVLIDGSRLCREVHATFFGAKKNLNLVAVFSPRLKSPEELSISKPEKLLVLMLRGSYLLKDVNIVDKLEALTVLEISGSKDLTGDFPDLFHIVSQLRSLDLSGAGIKSLPPSFSELTELRRLILKGCSYLESLPKMGKFSKLEVIDLSDCISLKKIQEKSFESLAMLKRIDFSRTKLEKFPIVKKLKHLTILLLQGCSSLSGMRMLKQVTTIKVLDLSGATNIKEIMYDCFEGANGLREVDLSETKIQFLPLHEGNNFQKLRLRGCNLLRNLPELRRHTLLEELDLSGCETLQNLPDLSTLEKLKTLDLSGTKLWSKELVESLSHIKDLEILPKS